LAGGMAQVVEYLPHKYKATSSNPSTSKTKTRSQIYPGCMNKNYGKCVKLSQMGETESQDNSMSCGAWTGSWNPKQTLTEVWDPNQVWNIANGEVVLLGS
jgi:hypothetical protein